MKVLISKKTGTYGYYNEQGDYHCKEGFIKEKELKSGKSRVMTDNTKREFIVFDANNYDISKRFKRGPQLITSKDLGYIMSRCYIGKNDFIVEAGSGSGAATAFFANIAKKVHSYEIIADHLKIAKRNVEIMGYKNVEFFHKDLAENIENEKDIDMLFLDMPNPIPVLEKDLSGIKMGKYIVCYLPSISQIQEVTTLISQREDLYLEEISEIILRHWRVWERISRPDHRKEIDHTAFLVFIRKV
jgi:tRNA (adenine57-N1/adenine58-N1)-methyltransferase